MSKMNDYIFKKTDLFPGVLPPNLRNFNGTGKTKTHTDWFGPLKSVSRAWNVAGPRVGKGNPGYAPWPPKLVEGFGVSKFETSATNEAPQSVIWIPALNDRHINATTLYGLPWTGVETNKDHPDFRKQKPIIIRWTEAIVRDVPHSWKPNTWAQIVEPNDYMPSAIQDFSKKGWMILEPDYVARWNWFMDFDPMNNIVARGYFYRDGNRPDAEDEYYNKSIKPLPGFIGTKGE